MELFIFRINVIMKMEDRAAGFPRPISPSSASLARHHRQHPRKPRQSPMHPKRLLPWLYAAIRYCYHNDIHRECAFMHDPVLALSPPVASDSRPSSSLPSEPLNIDPWVTSSLLPCLSATSSARLICAVREFLGASTVLAIEGRRGDRSKIARLRWGITG